MAYLKRYGWVIIVLIVISFLLFKHEDKDAFVHEKEAEPPLNGQVSDQDEHTSSVVKVDVKGEVVHPGVYTVKNGMRVDDVISLAGGLTSKADPASVNFAQKLEDEMVVLVTSSSAAMNQGSGAENENQGKVVRINQASQEEIEKLPGIGPSKAAAIIKYREEQGLFKKKEDLLEVSGIGEKTLEVIAENLQVP
ncbi:helix-hairpin-helix domain-containing protein [Halobacillus salinarum]|uniref:Helix-hairpin-helix domain-containing protein n=1 Tax=Halobacillus salinarum TaxID=2932257 RepID=A0ABY4ER10_9BACI|nr:helix-hairpin-helix domain-containing protein [Halobacillus salinarum]UOQ46323.1 helix-hairpin-helix domain-containing protein [Halobacillus salinarum]